jgi:chemotaxis response regulator CheB
MKIMIINDSKAMRLFLEDIVKSYFDWQLIGSYSDATYALSVLEKKKPM